MKYVSVGCTGGEELRHHPVGCVRHEVPNDESPRAEKAEREPDQKSIQDAQSAGDQVPETTNPSLAAVFTH
jgi:hypothetical protein